MIDPTIKLDKEIQEKLEYLATNPQLSMQERMDIRSEIRFLRIRKKSVERMKKNGVKF